MNAAQDLGALWASASRLGKASLLIAALCAVLALSSWLPQAASIYSIIYPLHVAMMILMASTFVMVAWRHFTGLFREATYVVPKSLPGAYWICLWISLAYFIAVFFGYALILPNRSPLAPTVALRIATSAYLLLGLGSFGMVHRAGRRQRAGRTA